MFANSGVKNHSWHWCDLPSCEEHEMSKLWFERLTPQLPNMDLHEMDAERRDTGKKAVMASVVFFKSVCVKG